PIGAHRIAPRLPERIGSSLRALPRVTRPLSMGLAACTALAAQGLVAAMGWLLVTDLAPTANGPLIFALVPVGLAAAHLPVAIAGLGVREAAFVALLPSAGVAPPEAAAGSLALLGAQLVTAAFGGLAQWVQPARRAPDS
ncbi:MAG: flippase-like domain-containing protein, partial [Myxococcota bacterium]|nr:flippase-like domain-containing protein [Myxococcota bacterium]